MRNLHSRDNSYVNRILMFTSNMIEYNWNNANGICKFYFKHSRILCNRSSFQNAVNLIVLSIVAKEHVSIVASY